ANAKRLLAFRRDGQMGHRGGMARQRFRAAKTDRQLRDLERVEKGERLRLPALEIEGEGRSRAGAMAAVDVRLPIGFGEAEIDDLFHLRLVLEPGANLFRIFARAAHP